MLQNVITDLVCVNCDANLMADLAEDGALFDTARGNGGTQAICQQASTVWAFHWMAGCGWPTRHT